MIKIHCDKLPRIIKNKKRLEKALNVKLTNSGAEVSIKSEKDNAVDEHDAEQVIDAINLGFPINVALLVKTEDAELETLNIKDYAKTKNFERVRARIIGKNGKALKTLSTASDCYFELKENQLGIIGDAEKIQAAQEAAISLIKGTKHSNVYAFLEKHQPKPIDDLGLKDES
jgi:ribosomal RNA assembly protein